MPIPKLQIKNVRLVDDEATGKACREWRESLNVTQGAVKVTSGWSQAFIGFLECGKRHWNPVNLEKYIKAVQDATQ